MNRISAVSTSVSLAYTIVGLEAIDRDGAIGSALSTAEVYTDSNISAEVTNRDSADSTALSTAKVYTDDAASTEVMNRNNAISTSLSTAVSTEVANRNLAISTATLGTSSFVSVPLGLSSASSTTVIPAGSIILGIRVAVISAYDASSTLNVIVNGTAPFNILQDTDSLYLFSTSMLGQLIALDSGINYGVISSNNSGVIECTVVGSATMGSGVAIIEYVPSIFS